MKKLFISLILTALAYTLVMADANNFRVYLNTSTEFTALNPVLTSGDIGYETDTRRMKVGNGSTDWNHLGYTTIGTTDTITATIVSATTVSASSVTATVVSAASVSTTAVTTLGVLSSGTITGGVFSSGTFSLNHGTCFKAAGVMGFCSNVLSSTGTCTCN